LRHRFSLHGNPPLLREFGTSQKKKERETEKKRAVTDWSRVATCASHEIVSACVCVWQVKKTKVKKKKERQ
jgi:hypothetical protein